MIRIKPVCLIVICFIVMFALQSSAIITEEQKYNLDELLNKNIEGDSIKLLELENKLSKVQYETNIKDYEDFKRSIGEYEQRIVDINNSMKVAKHQYNMSTGESSKSMWSAAMVSIYNNFSAARTSYRLRVKQYINTIKNLEPAIFAKENADKQKEEDIKKAQFSLKNDYYNHYILTKEIEMMKKDIENLYKQIEIEKVKESLGMTTDLTLYEVEIQKFEYDNMLYEMENKLMLATEKIKTDLGIESSEEFEIIHELPEKDTFVEYDVNDLIDAFKENNLQIAFSKNNIKVKELVLEKLDIAYRTKYEYADTDEVLTEEQQAMLKTAELEVEKAKLEHEILEKSMDLLVKQIYYQYIKTHRELTAESLNTRRYDAKLEIEREKLSQGTISKVAFDTQKAAIDRKLFDIERDKINYELACDKIEMIKEGINPGQTGQST